TGAPRGGEDDGAGAAHKGRRPARSVYAARMSGIDRREFLKAGAAGLLGLAAGEVGAAPEAPRVRRRVVLGRTGLEVPDVGFGSRRLAGDVGVVLHALARCRPG